MIGKLKGVVDFIRGDYAILEVGGVGYRVYMNESSLGKVAGLDHAEVYIYTDVKEDSLKLFGFLAFEEYEVFELLISVSGVGPKAGMAILNIASPVMIKRAVVNGDASVLTRVSGIGKKTADRIVLELKSKLDKIHIEGEDAFDNESGEIIDALMAMGYTARQSRDAVKAIPPEVKNISEKIKLAIKSIKL